MLGVVFHVLRNLKDSSHSVCVPAQQVVRGKVQQSCQHSRSLLVEVLVDGQQFGHSVGSHELSDDVVSVNEFVLLELHSHDEGLNLSVRNQNGRSQLFWQDTDNLLGVAQQHCLDQVWSAGLVGIRDEISHHLDVESLADCEETDH